MIKFFAFTLGGLIAALGMATMAPALSVALPLNDATPWDYVQISAATKLMMGALVMFIGVIVAHVPVLGRW